MRAETVGLIEGHVTGADDEVDVDVGTVALLSAGVGVALAAVSAVGIVGANSVIVAADADAGDKGVARDIGVAAVVGAVAGAVVAVVGVIVWGSAS